MYYQFLFFKVNNFFRSYTILCYDLKNNDILYLLVTKVSQMPDLNEKLIYFSVL